MEIELMAYHSSQPITFVGFLFRLWLCDIHIPLAILVRHGPQIDCWNAQLLTNPRQVFHFEAPYCCLTAQPLRI
jgi:hypothetical protein